MLTDLPGRFCCTSLSRESPRSQDPQASPQPCPLSQPRPWPLTSFPNRAHPPSPSIHPTLQPQETASSTALSSPHPPQPLLPLHLQVDPRACALARPGPASCPTPPPPCFSSCHLTSCTQTNPIHPSRLIPEVTCLQEATPAHPLLSSPIRLPCSLRSDAFPLGPVISDAYCYQKSNSKRLKRSQCDPFLL